MPKKHMNEIPISPVMMKAMPKPFNGAGILEYFSFSRIAAIPTIARHQPIPEPAAKVVASAKVEYSLSCMNKEAPMMAQFTAINGKKMPKDEYKEGEYLSTIISTSCTIAAMTAMNMMKLKKLKSTSAKAGLSHESPPSTKRYLLIKKLAGTVINITKMTAMPNPNEVFTFLEMAKNEHIPKK